MALYYPVGNVTNPIEWLQWINVLTNHYFGPTVVAAFFLIIFFAMKRYETEKAFVASSFLATIFSFLMLILDLVDVQVVMLTMIMTIVSVFFIKQSSGGL